MVIYLPQHHCRPWPVNCQLLHLCSNFIPSLVTILVLPSGSVSLLLLATVLDLNIEWNVLTMSMLPIVIAVDAVSAMCHWFSAWSWPWSGHGASASTGLVTSLWTPAVSWCSTSASVWVLSVILHDDLQHKLKWFLEPHLWHFLPKAGQSLNWCIVLHLLHILLSWVLWLLILCEPLVLVPFLPLHLNVLIASTVVSCAIPPFDLWQLKSFTIISCSLAYWSNAWYVMSSCHFFDRIHFFTSKCLVAWNKSSVLCTSFSSVEYWHLSMRFLILWSSWSVDSLSPCLMSL